MFKVPEKYRVTDGPMPSDSSYGNNGVFQIPPMGNNSGILVVIASDGDGWEHVSVSGRYVALKKTYTPSWDEMCYIKSLFWTDDECVVQYHPAKEDYVNNHPDVLHLWKEKGKEFPKPPKYMI